MDHPEYLFAELLRGFEWFDEGLQRGLQAAGWPGLTRPESMVMIHVQMGIVRPSAIARSLRLTRQAIHLTIASLVRRDIFRLEADPADARHRRVVLTAQGEAMRADAVRIVRALNDELVYRIGAQQTEALRAAFRQPWGEVPTIAPSGAFIPSGDVDSRAVARHLRATGRKRR